MLSTISHAGRANFAIARERAGSSIAYFNETRLSCDLIARGQVRYRTTAVERSYVRPISAEELPLLHQVLRHGRVGRNRGLTRYRHTTFLPQRGYNLPFFSPLFYCYAFLTSIQSLDVWEFILKSDFSYKKKFRIQFL